MVNRFKKIFMDMIQEDMMASTAFTAANVDAGGTGGSFGNVDSYAPGDARVPHALGTVDPRKNKKKKKDRKKEKRKKSRKTRKEDKDFPPQGYPIIQTRNTGMTGPSNKNSLGFM